MNHGAMLWGAALYNNGAFPLKNYRYGQAYGADGAPLKLINPTRRHAEDTRTARHSAFPRAAAAIQPGQPGQHSAHLRKRRRETTCSSAFQSPTNRRANRRADLSERGLGTLNRTDPVFLGLQKTRLHDPLLGFLGSNDHPGRLSLERLLGLPRRLRERSFADAIRLVEQVRQSGTEFHRRSNDSEKRARPSDQAPVHALDSVEPMHELPHAPGQSLRESVSRLHLVGPGNRRRIHVSEEAAEPDRGGTFDSLRKNPEAAAARGLWGDKDFLEKVAELNPKLKHTQFADYHGHGWVFRAVFKHDRKGNLLDLDDNMIRAR